MNAPNPMIELKAKDCAFCEQSPVSLSNGKVGCKTITCPIIGIEFDIDQWNTRPRERELEGVLKDARLRAQGRLRVHWNSVDELSDGTIKECICADCESNAGTVSAINSVLGKGGE